MANTKKILLDGKQSCSGLITLRNDSGDIINDNINVLVKGYLKFGTSKKSENQQSDSQQNASISVLENRTSVFPVLFVEKQISISNGKAVITLLPRSEDILQSTNVIFSRSEFSGNISMSEEIEESFGITKIIIVADVERTPYEVEIQITVDDTFHFGQTVDTNIQKTDNLKISNFVPSVYKQFDSPKVQYYSNIEWLPTIEVLLGNSNSTYDETLEIIENLSNSVSFGSSTIFDAIVKASTVLADSNIDDIRKLIYIFTDNESNISTSSVDEAIESVNDIDGEKEVPILIGNLSIVDPIVLSAKANATDVKDLIKMSALTGGQSVTVLSANFVDEIADLFTGAATGALGYGTFDFTVDLGEIVSLNKVSASFDLPINTNASWSILVSEDGYTFSNINEKYGPNDEISFRDLQVRYVRFAIILLTGFSSSDDPYIDNPYIDKSKSPVLTQVGFVFNKYKISYLYLNLETIESIPQNIVLSTNVNEKYITPDQIKIGATTSESHNFNDFDAPSHFAVDQNGKTIIPIRYFENTDNFSQENLIKIDSFMYKTTYGRWDPTSSVSIFDKNGDLVNSDSYRIYSRKGLVIFNSTKEKEDSFTINILDKSRLRVGLKITSKSEENNLEIFGLGYMYNTNINLLPPIAKMPPEATNVIISPSTPKIYSTIALTYIYNDINFDKEDKNKTIIKWYINDIYISFLDGKRIWNNINDYSDPIFEYAFTFDPNSVSDVESQARLKKESLLKIGDKIYCTVKASDGNLFGSTVKSNIVEVKEAIPIVSEVKILSMDNNGVIRDPKSGSEIDRLSVDRTAILQYDFATDVDRDISEIIWHVVDSNNNDGEFKKGLIGESNIDRILPGEVNENNVLALDYLNELYVTITPQTGTSTGSIINSETVLVKHSIPEINNVRIFNDGGRLLLTCLFYDFEIYALGRTDQTNSSFVNWLKYNPITSQFENILEIDIGLDSNTSGDSFSEMNEPLISGDKWKAIVTPSKTIVTEGLVEKGIPVESDIITIVL